MDRPNAEMAEWHAPWENSRDVEDGEVAGRLFGALHSLGGRQLAATGSSSFVLSENHWRRHGCRRTAGASPCNNNSQIGGPPKQWRLREQSEAWAADQGEDQNTASRAQKWHL